MKVYAIILAAGQARRMKANKNKMFLQLKKPILAHTLKMFENCDKVDEIILVANEIEIKNAEKIVEEHGFSKVAGYVVGGSERQRSSYNGVFSLNAADDDIVIIHDGARPFIREETILGSIKDASKFGASVVGVPAKNTIKTVNNEHIIESTLKRDNLWVIQTPQTFRFSIIKKAHEKAKEEKFLGTDDSVLAERLGIKVKLTRGHYDNIKITTPDDLILAENILRKNNDENV